MKLWPYFELVKFWAPAPLGRGPQVAKFSWMIWHCAIVIAVAMGDLR